MHNDSSANLHINYDSVCHNTFTNDSSHMLPGVGLVYLPKLIWTILKEMFLTSTVCIRH